MGAWTSLVGFQRNIYRNRVVETHHKIKSRELELFLHTTKKRIQFSRHVVATLVGLGNKLAIQMLFCN